MLCQIVVILFITHVSVAQNICSWDDLCSTQECPPGMKCSQIEQACVCDNTLSYNSLDQINLTATVFDFMKNNSDFENGEPDPVSVDSKLGSNGFPVFHNETRFDYFFQNTSGVNLVTDVTLYLTKISNNLYKLDYLNYFPIDNILYGNEGNAHNYHFSTKTSWQVDYNGGEYIYLRYDDGVLLYLNNYLIVNEPGLNYNGSKHLLLDSVAGDTGMVPGNSYTFNVFHLERHTIESIFYIETDLLVHPPTCPQTCDDDSDCSHGLCHSFEKVCHCQKGWAGYYCDKSLCWNVECGSHGHCNPYNGTCTCDEGFTGSECQFRECNYHGQGTDNCTCDKYYIGENCEECVKIDTIGNRYICIDYGTYIMLMSMIPEQYAGYIERSDSFEPGTNGLDCSCSHDVKPSLIGTATDLYYQNRIEVLVQGNNGNVNLFEDSVSSSNVLDRGMLSYSVFLFWIMSLH